MSKKLSKKELQKLKSRWVSQKSSTTVHRLEDQLCFTERPINRRGEKDGG